VVARNAKKYKAALFFIALDASVAITKGPSERTTEVKRIERVNPSETNSCVCEMIAKVR
jgi:hypothetical protein